MRIINANDSDDRSKLQELEARAKEAHQFLNDYESLMGTMRAFMQRCGATPPQVEQMHPAQFCHEVLAEYGRKKLGE